MNLPEFPGLDEMLDNLHPVRLVDAIPAMGKGGKKWVLSFTVTTLI